MGIMMNNKQITDVDKRKVTELVMRYREHQHLAKSGKVRCSQCNEIVGIKEAIVCTRNNQPLVITCDNCSKRGSTIIEYVVGRKAFHIQHRPYTQIVLTTSMPKG
jgi:hypothetical protein